MPYCQNCGKEVPADAKFCANCGAATQGASTPAQSLGYTPPNPLADLGSRIAAGIVDFVIIGIITVALAVALFFPFWVTSTAVTTGGFGMTDIFPVRTVSIGIVGGVIIVIMVFLWLIYFTYFEGTSGQTIGKKLTNIKVVKEDGSKCDFGSALVRNILRIVDQLPFLYILGIILIAATDKRQRLGDMLAKTIVVKT